MIIEYTVIINALFCYLYRESWFFNFVVVYMLPSHFTKVLCNSVYLLFLIVPFPICI